jgi:hypothetical protein
MKFDSHASCIYCGYAYTRTNDNRVCQLCYEQIQEDILDNVNYYRKVNGARTVLAGNLADYATPRDQYGVSNTPQSGAGNALETIGCVHCRAAYGHKINCPIFFSYAILPQATAPLTEYDIELLKGLKIERF